MEFFRSGIIGISEEIDDGRHIDHHTRERIAFEALFVHNDYNIYLLHYIVVGFQYSLYLYVRTWSLC